MSRERTKPESKLLATEKVVSAIGDGIYQLDPDGRFVAVNDAVTETTGYDREELLGEHVSLLVDGADVRRLEDEIADLLSSDPDGVRTTELLLQGATGEEVQCEIRFSVVLSDGEFLGTVGVTRDTSWKKRRDAALKAQRDELTQLRHINAVVRSIDRAVVRADTVEGIEQAVCDRIAAAEPYRFALISRFDPELETLTPEVWAGIGEEYAENLREADFIDSDGEAVEATRTRSVQVVRDATTEVHDWKGPVSDTGRWSMAFVPLVHDRTVYGVLGVYSDRPFAFEGPERDVLDELGEMVGYALSAVKTRLALVGDRTIELTFQFSDDEYLFTVISEELDCVARFEDAILHPDGAMLLYVSIEGADPEHVLDFCREFGVTHLRGISEREDECLLEIRYDEPMAFSVLTNHGGIIRSATAEDGVARVTVDMPETGNVREVVKAMTGVFENSELISRQTIEQPTETRARFRDTLEDRLTERQRTVLTTAYRAGYYDWPRGSTGEELAESLDIAPPTLHKHLRLAERKVLSGIFDERDRD
ncbi:bacterio-opsin activator domain-containing protein [Haladaptatus sp. R4]|uniref:bacterio-opsin activator domain-containing protein n=1 Tax=Haladaptatus sp. R4 TaxID=1679489 RepID=UPI0009ED4A82|nr:bacterio-opsin activator domain-containing protein [Haladaptatus sp. R4]